MKRKQIGNVVLIVLVLGIIIYGTCFSRTSSKAQEDAIEVQEVQDIEENKDIDQIEEDSEQEIEEDSVENSWEDDLEDEWKEDLKDGLEGMINELMEDISENIDYDWEEEIELPEKVFVSSEDLEVITEKEDYKVIGVGELSEYSESIIPKIIEDGKCESSAILSIRSHINEKRILSVQSLTGSEALICMDAKQATTLRGELTTYTTDDDINVFINYEDTFVLLPLNCEFEIEIPKGKSELLIICDGKKFKLEAEVKPDDTYTIIDDEEEWNDSIV